MSENLEINKTVNHKDVIQPDVLVDPFAGLNDTMVQLAHIGNIDDMATEKLIDEQLDEIEKRHEAKNKTSNQW